MKKRLLMSLLAGMVMISVSACQAEEPAENSAAQESGEDDGAAGQDQAEEQDGQDQAADSGNEAQADGAQGGSDILVAYVTYAENADLPDGVDASASASIQVWNGDVTGNTGAIARMISEKTGADLFSIQTVEKYPDNYNDTLDQGQEEQSEGARPELSSQIEDISAYNTVFLGYPNWWGDMPMAVYSFLDEYDLSGKTVIPFVTSGGSGFSGTLGEIESMEPGADVQEGISVSASGAANAQEEVSSWLSELGY